MRFRTKNSEKTSPGCAMVGGGVFVLFGLVFAGFGLVFAGFGLFSFFDSVRVGSWDEVPCEIERFEIVDSADEKPPFRAEVAFRYEYDGVPRTGDLLRKGGGDESDFEDLEELRREVLAEISSTCRVNPADPDEAVLLKSGGQAWMGLAFAAFGGLFALIGVGSMVATRRQAKKGRAKSADGDGDGKAVGLPFFALFALAGVAVLFGFVVPKALDWWRMQRWVETPGEVIWSRVRSHSGDDGTTYSVDIFYRYDFGGTEYRSNRWNVIGGSSSGREGKQNVVSAHPSGAGVRVFVDPDEPWRAVANRELGWWALFGLFPLPFMAVGFGGMWVTLRKKREAAAGASRLRNESATSLRPAERVDETHFTGGRGKRIGAFFGVLVMAVFWNGLIWWLPMQEVIEGWRKGDTPVFLALFMVPFVGIGLLLVALVPYCLLRIFSPVYEVKLAGGPLRPGGRTRLEWRRAGGGGQPRRLVIYLIGREEATYRRGTTTTTARSVFHEQVLVENTTAGMMARGACELRLPADAVPSFDGQHNKIRWLWVLAAEVPWRPDVHEEHEIKVGVERS